MVKKEKPKKELQFEKDDVIKFKYIDGISDQDLVDADGQEFTIIKVYDDDEPYEIEHENNTYYLKPEEVEAP